MHNANLQQRNAQITADVLAEQETEPTGDDEEHHTPRVPAHNYVKRQTKHGGDHKGKYEYGVRHRGCDSVFQW